MTAIASVRHLELDRPEYWRAALLLFVRQPWLGWGDDRFRLLYHEYVPREAFDERARAHSWLIETAVDLGLVGVLVLLVLAFAVGRAVVRLVRRGEREVDGPALAAAAALAGLAVHMQVDYFLAYTQVAMLFWPLVGLACGSARRRLVGVQGPVPRDDSTRELPWPSNARASASSSTANPATFRKT